jgi:hypothetical protein
VSSVFRKAASTSNAFGFVQTLLLYELKEIVTAGGVKKITMIMACFL